MTIAEEDRVHGCLLGLATGDALGTTVEFQPRGSFDPLTDMVGGGPFRLAPGEWTDDTAMALCLAASLLERDGFDPSDQMERYCRWRDDGYMSSTGRCFDIGTTVAAALRRYRETGEALAGSTDPWAAGNGCLMRLAPVPLYYFPDAMAAVHYAGESARTTHGAAACVEACRLLAGMICRALRGEDKMTVLLGDADAPFGTHEVASVARGDYLRLSRDAIHGTGYVVACLQAAAWCVATTERFDLAVLTAANLGDDADTTAAVCGQLAGALYGAAAIPGHWLARLARRAEIAALAARLHATRRSPEGPQP